MSVSLTELPTHALAEVCTRRSQISTRPLIPSEYYPPGASRNSRAQTGVDADKIYDATVGQHTHILQQLGEAEKNARDALFALEIMEAKLAQEAAAMKSALSHLSEILPPQELERICDFAFSESKRDWEKVWKHEWVEDDTQRSNITTPSGGSSKNPRANPPPAPHPPSSPLPPSSPPPPTSPFNPPGSLLTRNNPVRVGGFPTREFRWPSRPSPPTVPDEFRTSWGFGNDFGTTGCQPNAAEIVAEPSQPQQPRRLGCDG